MKLFVKIGLITLLFLLKYQGATADTTSIDRSSFAQAIQAVDQKSSTDRFSSENDLYINSCMTCHQQQVMLKLVPEDMRIRRGEEQQLAFLKVLIGHFSLRETNLVSSQEKCFPSYPIHCVKPACKYFVFALRRILI